MAEFLANDDAVVAAHKHTVYDLIANICHDGQPGKCVCVCVCVYSKTMTIMTGKGTYRVHVRQKVHRVYGCLLSSRNF